MMSCRNLRSIRPNNAGISRRLVHEARFQGGLKDISHLRRRLCVYPPAKLRLQSPDFTPAYLVSVSKLLS